MFIIYTYVFYIYIFILIPGDVKIKYMDTISDKEIEMIAGTWLAKAKERLKYHHIAATI